MSVDAAVRLLEQCTEWSPREALVNLPNCYFNVSAVTCISLDSSVHRSRPRADDDSRCGRGDGHDQGDVHGRRGLLDQSG